MRKLILNLVLLLIFAVSTQAGTVFGHVTVDSNSPPSCTVIWTRVTLTIIDGNGTLLGYTHPNAFGDYSITVPNGVGYDLQANVGSQWCSMTIAPAFYHINVSGDLERNFVIVGT